VYNGFLVTAALYVLLLVAFGTSAQGEGSVKHAAPSYSVESVLNSTTYQPGPFAPNTIVSIFGEELAYSEEAAPAHALPLRLARVQVLSMRGQLGEPLPLHYVGPGQINFLLPDSLEPGPVFIRVSREGTAGPEVRIVLQETAPALFPWGEGLAIALHVEGELRPLITPDHPARPGEAVELYATGLGRAALVLKDGEVPAIPPFTIPGLTLKKRADLRVLVAGQPLDPARIIYAGLTPGCAALYQINFFLPENAPSDPEIRIAIGERISLEGLKLPLRP
jgi:uncharacterized protein (TIGR03437 family)